MKFFTNKSWKKKEENLREEIKAEFIKTKSVVIDGKKIIVTPGPVSKKDNTVDGIPFIQRTLKVLQADFGFDVIPIIRKLAKVNPDMGQALDDFVKLANTGHIIKFDPSVGADQIDIMRKFIKDSAKKWSVGAAGVNGVVNKMFRQAMISGAIATEWVPNMNLDDIEEVRFLYPERIRFVQEKNNRRYVPYQKIKHKPIDNVTMKDLKRLNPNQFKYFALNGDTDVPYGTPPYLPALYPIVTQRKMIDNIDYIVETMGILGYLNASIQKPQMNPNENEDQYKARAKQLLVEFKDRVKEGFRDGINVGFIDDHEFEFTQTAKTATGATDLFNQNELQVASGLKVDAAFMGRPGSTETLITILFTKMLAQLANIQGIIIENLEFGYKLALTLGGHNFKGLSVEFNKSTITDNLKWQQGEEIKIRNLVVKYHYGIIGSEQFADELGYLKPDKSEPRIDINNDDPVGGSVQKQNREKSKDASDKKSRDKSKPQGTVKRQNKLEVV